MQLLVSSSIIPCWYGSRGANNWDWVFENSLIVSIAWFCFSQSSDFKSAYSFFQTASGVLSLIGDGGSFYFWIKLWCYFLFKEWAHGTYGFHFTNGYNSSFVSSLIIYSFKFLKFSPFETTRGLLPFTIN